MYGQPNNWRYFADVYLDYSRARVVLGNAPTLSASTIREVQVPTSWSGSSISISANLGRFTAGQTAYVFVVDANGTPNGQGFPVTMGATGPDTTRPIITSTSPTNSATNVSAAATITATFNEAMNAATIGTSTFELRDSANALVSAAVTYNASTRVVTLDPASNLGASETYVATLEGGSTGVKDSAGNSLAANAVWSFTVAATAPPPTGALVLGLSFNDNAGTVAVDSSGNSNNATLQGATWTTAGRYGSGLTFNGLDNSLTVPDAPSLDLSTGMTLEAWVYPTALSGWRTVVLKEVAGGLAYALYAHDNAPKPSSYVRLTGSSIGDGVAGTLQLPLNTWTHLASTYDGSMQRLFVDGVEVANAALSGSMLASASVLRIGGNSIWGEYFTGVIDEVRIYSRALTAAEIQADRNAPIGGGTNTGAPTVTSVTPAANAVGVNSTVSLTAVFNEAMQASTINGTTFVLRDPSNALVTATVSYNSTTRTVTLDPGGTMTVAGVYRGTIKGGTSGVKDTAGNALAADFTWTFTTTGTPSAPTNVRIVR